MSKHAELQTLHPDPVPDLTPSKPFMVEELAKSKIGRCPAVNAHLRPGAVKILAAITYDGENFNI